ncbi:hypothetical protein [Parerythrobacter lacustris]|uniref:DUF4235 domain-containing protein n=1 Tax=Parerythrobacter lacustris TaxID=2969984 RepID=A0ABT1XQT9_9SPHN|nr:hypothetical protein [Parerythrobacter lacustris]MCR2832995.1 hypothetical protein [Parerythrobacter lacustris]
MAKRRRTKTVDQGQDVPGLSENPATNLLLAEIAMRAGSTVMRRVLERGLLKGRYGRDTAKDIIGNRSLKRTLATTVVSRFATRSVPGALLVGTGLAAKLLFDRSQKRRKAKREGDAKLLDQATKE